MLFVVGVEKTALLDPGRLPSPKPESDRKIPPIPAPCFAPPATVVVSALPTSSPPRPPATPGCNSPEKWSDLEDSDLSSFDLEDSNRWRWCHSAHDVVGKARLSQGMSSHRKNATCALKTTAATTATINMCGERAASVGVMLHKRACLPTPLSGHRQLVNYHVSFPESVLKLSTVLYIPLLLM